MKYLNLNISREFKVFINTLIPYFISQILKCVNFSLLSHLEHDFLNTSLILT